MRESLLNRKINKKFWHRTYISQPVHIANFTVFIYMVSMSSMFISSQGISSWESLINDMDDTDKAYFSMIVVFFIPFVSIQMLLSLIHVGAWRSITDKNTMEELIELSQDMIQDEPTRDADHLWRCCCACDDYIGRLPLQANESPDAPL